jgi:Lar family restriction alleviation protein
MDVELKPCPFCGSPAVQMVSGSPGCHYVRCEGCGATSNDCSRERAIALWNRRDGQGGSDGRA